MMPESKIQRIELPQAFSGRSSYCKNPLCLQMSGSREKECGIWGRCDFYRLGYPVLELRKEWSVRFLISESTDKIWR